MWIGISGFVMHLLPFLFVMCLFMYVVALIIMQGVATDVVEAAVVAVIGNAAPESIKCCFPCCGGPVGTLETKCPS